MNGSIIESKPLYVVVAQTKEERRTYLAKEHTHRIATSRVPTQMPLSPCYPMGMMRSQLSSPLGAPQPRGFYRPIRMSRTEDRNIPIYSPSTRWNGSVTGPANFQVRSQQGEIEHFATFFSIYHYSKGQTINSQMQWSQASADTSEGRISPPNVRIVCSKTTYLNYRLFVSEFCYFVKSHGRL